jgi:hypothetical protein
MNLRIILTGLLLTGVVSADTLTLRDGRKIEGTFMGGDSRQVRIATGDKIESYPVTDVWSLMFGAAQGANPTGAVRRPMTNGNTSTTRSEAYNAPAYSTSGSSTTTTRLGPVDLPSGTNIMIRMVDDVDSERDRIGQTYRATTDEVVSLNGQEVIPRGSDVIVKLIDDKQAGRVSGRSVVTLDLVSVSVGGRMVDLNTANVTQSSDSRSKRSAEVIGGTAAVGAIIGAIAGGGRGAAIGAASGAGAGTAVQVLTKGPKVKIPAETRLTFTLEQPVRL